MADKAERSLTPQSISKLQNWLVDQVARNVELQGSDRPPVEHIQRLLNNALDHAQVNFEETQRERIIAAAIDDLYGLGPIQPLLDDPDITDVMINGAQKVFIEREGKLEKTDIVFPDEDAVL
jgi:pilus assembly protein CpaF